MRATVLLVALLLLAGCSGHANVRYASGQVSGAPPGASFTRSGLQVGVRTSNVAAALVVLGALGIATHFGREDPRSGIVYRTHPLPAAQSEPSDAPQRVHEQDCSRPIEDPSANLRCRQGPQ